MTDMLRMLCFLSIWRRSSSIENCNGAEGATSGRCTDSRQDRRATRNAWEALVRDSGHVEAAERRERGICSVCGMRGTHLHHLSEAVIVVRRYRGSSPWSGEGKGRFAWRRRGPVQKLRLLPEIRNLELALRVPGTRSFGSRVDCSGFRVFLAFCKSTPDPCIL